MFWFVSVEFLWCAGSWLRVLWRVTDWAIPHLAAGSLLRRICAMSFDGYFLASSISRLASWIFVDRSMEHLEELKECSPHLGDISLNECMGECHILQSYGED
jgi:hypothetical protein